MTMSGFEKNVIQKPKEKTPTFDATSQNKVLPLQIVVQRFWSNNQFYRYFHMLDCSMQLKDVLGNILNQ